MVSALFHGCELVFAYAADGAYPVVGEVGKCGPGLDAVVGVSYCRVVYPVADFTYIFLVHSSDSLIGVSINKCSYIVVYGRYCADIKLLLKYFEYIRGKECRQCGAGVDILHAEI